jgi:hypothetical protein
MNKKYSSDEERRLAKKEYRKEYYQNHKEYQKAYYQTHKKERKIYAKKYNENRKEDKRHYENNKLKTDINYKLAKNLRTRLYLALKENWKLGSAVKDLGCTIPELKIYLEKQFEIGMTWDNWGEWHIDHIRPLSKFNLQNREEFLQANHYTNLQPLWAKENIKKNNK